MNLLKESLMVEPNGAAASFGHLFLRVSAGLMIFYIHGWHKLEGWIDYLQHGTPWKLVEEVAGMHMPAPSHRRLRQRWCNSSVHCSSSLDCSRESMLLCCSAP